MKSPAPGMTVAPSTGPEGEEGCVPGGSSVREDESVVVVVHAVELGGRGAGTAGLRFAFGEATLAHKRAARRVARARRGRRAGGEHPVARHALVVSLGTGVAGAGDSLTSRTLRRTRTKLGDRRGLAALGHHLWLQRRLGNRTATAQQGEAEQHRRHSKRTLHEWPRQVSGTAASLVQSQ